LYVRGRSSRAGATAGHRPTQHEPCRTQSSDAPDAPIVRPRTWRDTSHSASPASPADAAIVANLIATDNGRHRVLDAIDRALSCIDRPVDGPARYHLAELGMALERAFFMPIEGPLVRALGAMASRTAYPLASLIAAWLGDP